VTVGLELKTQVIEGQIWQPRCERMEPRSYKMSC